MLRAPWRQCECTLLLAVFAFWTKSAAWRNDYSITRVLLFRTALLSS